MKRTRIKKEAFTLIETLIVLGIMVLVSIGIMTQLKSNAEKTRAKNAGEKIVEVGNALQSYVSDNKAALLAKIPVGTTQTLDDICVLNSAPGCMSGGLPMAEILPKSFTNNSLLETGYKISLKNVDNKGIQGIVYTDSSVTLAGATDKPRYDLLGYATKTAGNAVGFSNVGGDQIDGLNGGWSIKKADLPYDGDAGVLAYRTNGIDDYDGTYLRRDGSNSMTGDLLLGNNNIKNVNSLTADNYVTSQNAYFQTLRTQAIYNAGDIYTDSLNAATVFAGVVNTNKINEGTPNKDLMIGGSDSSNVNGSIYMLDSYSRRDMKAGRDITADMNVNATNNVVASVDVLAGRYVQIGGVQTKDASCSGIPLGTVSRDPKGKLLSCQDTGKWGDAVESGNGTICESLTVSTYLSWSAGGQSWSGTVYATLPRNTIMQSYRRVVYGGHRPLNGGTNIDAVASYSCTLTLDGPKWIGSFTQCVRSGNAHCT